MIQRLQSVYMFLSAGVSFGLSFLFSLWTNLKKVVVFAQDINYILILFLVSGTLSLVGIFMYKNRKNQFVINRLNILNNFVLLGIFVYLSLNLSGEIKISEKGIGLFLPVISIVLLALANKAIKRDENLVKSADRLR